jgi:hypothetical protein
MRSIALAVFVVAIVSFAPYAAAQSGTGTVTGRVVWGNCLPFPLTAVPGAEPAGAGGPVPAPLPAQPGSDASTAAPFPGRLLPAGAVLVAVQGTSASTRTDETGRFSLGNVPAGQYLTVAAGPVSGVAAASAWRPNVLVTSGQSVDVGVLPLGSGLALPCRYPPFPGGISPDTAPGTGPPTPPDSTVP